jgi:hypothetical protein
MAQTSYSLDHTEAADGMPADEQSPIIAEDLNVETAAGIAPGRVVSYGTAADGAILGGSNVAGVMQRNTAPSQASGNVPLISQYERGTVTKMGNIWAKVSGAVALTDTVAYNTTTGVLTAGPATTGELDLPGWKFRTAAADGAIAKVFAMPSIPVIPT